MSIATGEDRATRAARRRYNRVAFAYDLMELPVEIRYRYWRELLWSRAEGEDILEVGVGTGKNYTYYPGDARVTAIDFSERMLARARKRAERGGVCVRLELMDVQGLEFPENAFDTVIASFVFCSVPDPIKGLAEVERVLKAGGKLVLLEHVLSSNRVLAAFMNLLNPLVSQFLDNINRRTVENVARSGLRIECVTDLAYGIFKLIEARKRG